MPTRTARANWNGSLQKGVGKISLQSGACETAYSFGSRFEAAGGSNPEELLAAAHAGCFAMALSLELGKAGYEPERISAEARVTIAAVDGSFAIRSSHLVCEASVPGVDAATFAKIAEATKLGCPVSKALAAIEITLDARLIT
jgi:osmotically inducible protein OsmC